MFVVKALHVLEHICHPLLICQVGLLLRYYPRLHLLLFSHLFF
jgi:hypothetical protein